ncbi:transmembrane and coiled-coil domains-containing protein 7 [Terramyces sp. JEL0728]|nr:transmembrane and coiled-coil domains-containing protein 7 [Terramyces sp. JEL0728]
MTRDQLYLFSSSADKLNLNNPNLKQLLQERLSVEGDINELMEKYVLECINVIHELHLSSSELGIKDNRAASTLIAIIICCGIVPSLEPGLQTLLLKRYKYPTCLKTNIFSVCLNYVIYWVKNGRTPSYIAEIILQKHFSEILLILIHNDNSVNLNGPSLAIATDINKLDTGATDKSREIHSELQEYFEYNAELITMEIYIKKLPTLGIINALVRMMMNSSQFPTYIKTFTTKYLYQMLMRDDGCASLLHSLIKQDPDDHITFLHFEKISNIIQSPQHVDLPAYFDLICKQLLNILNSSIENKTGAALDSVLVSVKCAAFVVVNFINKRPKMSKTLLLKPILDPLLNYNAINTSCESTLTSNLPEIQEIDLDGKQIITTQDEILQCLRNIEYILIGNEPSYTLIENLISVVHPLYAIYQSTPNRPALQNQVFQILSIILKLMESQKAVAILVEITKNSVEKQTLEISNGSFGGIQFIESTDKHPIDPSLFAKFIQALEKPELVGDLFLQVLETRLVLISNEFGDTEELSIYYSGLIVALLDTFEDAILKNTAQILKFVKATLLDSDDDEKHMGLTLLSQLFNSKEEPIDDISSLNEIKTILSTLCDGNDEIAALARAVQAQLMALSKSENQSKSKEIFREALKELSDELLPIRAHGMNEIRKLVLQKDPVSIQHLESIINMFIDFLQDTDSFIYLNAIKGCSALADVYPEKTLNKLALIYKDMQYTDEVRTRMGESILQIIQRSGEIYPKYADIISPSVMVVLRQDSNLMKSSAIILSSHIAKQCPRSLLPFISQLFDYILGTIQFEKDLDLKKGILVLSTALLRGLKNSLIHHVGLDQMQKFRVLLENLILNERDLLAKGHAEVCLDDLNCLI